jgi:hypothetical protein
VTGNEAAEDTNPFIRLSHSVFRFPASYNAMLETFPSVRMTMASACSDL